MTAEKILQEINGSPYLYFYYVQERVTLPLQLDAIEMRVRKNGKAGKIEVVWGDNIYPFEWDKEKREWRVPE